jgi:hypothetical protein
LVALHLDLFDFAGAQALAEEAREIGHSLRWTRGIVSGGIDLLLNFARHGQGDARLALAHAPRRGEG